MKTREGWRKKEIWGILFSLSFFFGQQMEMCRLEVETEDKTEFPNVM